MRIDFHAHILPKMDHGCKDTEMFLNQMHLAEKNGIDVIVATSHFYPHLESVDSYLSRRDKAFEKAMDVYKGSIKILKGAEVLVCKGMDEMPDLEKLCVEGTNSLLLEMPLTTKIDSEIIQTVELIQELHKVNVILAHPHRYAYQDMLELLELPISVQMNGDAIKTFEGRKVIKECRKRNVIAAIGSDMHGIKTGYKYYNKLCKKLGTDLDNVMMRTRKLVNMD